MFLSLPSSLLVSALSFLSIGFHPAASSTPLATGNLTAQQGASARDAERLAESEALLAEDKPTAALAAIERALEDAPNSPLLLDGAARIALANGNEDLAVWYTKFGLAAIGEKPSREDKALVPIFEDRLAELDPRAAEISASLDEYADQVFRLGQAAQKRKLWANAVDLFMRTRGTAFEVRGEKALAKIFKSSNSAQAIVDSGLPIPPTETRKTASGIAAYNRKYAEWPKAAESREFYTKQYRIHTNMGWELGMAMANTMEQLNKHLRKVYQHKLSGKPLKTCQLDVFATYDEWKEVEEAEVGGGLSPNIGGFFSPLDNRISTYDQSTVGREFSGLWGTLFHEGSHQFKADITTNLMPGWVNEGVATYMEGSQLMPNGVMVPNLVPDDRIRPLVQMIGAKPPEEGQTSSAVTPDDANIDVEDFLTFFQGGSYSGRYYPWGWGFVYFIQNFEDENGDLVYLPFFKEYVDTYRSGGNHDIMDRWIEYFIEKPERPGIEDFEDWYAVWASWILELYKIHDGGEEQADVLCDRGDRQLSLGKSDRAFESYSWALRKDEKSVRAMWGLAQAKGEMGADDGAAYFLRQTLAWCDAQADDTAQVEHLEFDVGSLRNAALEQVASINSNLVDGASEAEVTFLNKVLDLSGQYLEAGQPRNAAQVLKDSIGVLGPVHELVAELATVQEDGGFSLQRPHRPVVDEELSRWLSGLGRSRWGAIENGVRVEGANGFNYLVYDEAPSTPYRLEAKITYESGEGFKFFGVAFGDSLSGRQIVGWLRASLFGKLEFKETGLEVTDVFAVSEFGRGDSVDFALQVKDGKAELYLDEEIVGSVPISNLEAAGRVGFVSIDASVKFEDIRILY